MFYKICFYLIFIYSLLFCLLYLAFIVVLNLLCYLLLKGLSVSHNFFPLFYSIFSIFFLYLFPFIYRHFFIHSCFTFFVCKWNHGCLYRRFAPPHSPLFLQFLLQVCGGAAGKEMRRQNTLQRIQGERGEVIEGWR